jgi:ADP-ribose pyrophosphatase YjhB (NUDIX family)
MDLSMMVEENVKFNYRAGLMIQKGDEILVEVNPEIDFVTIPGGRVKTMESSLAALQRELKEEMQVDILETEVIMKALIENFFEMNGRKYHELYILYKTTIDEYDTRFTNDMINHDSDASYYKWVKISDLAKENLLPAILRTLSNDDKFQNIINDDLKEDEDID